MFNQFGNLLPVNFNIQFRMFLTKTGYGALCLPFPNAPIPFRHADGTVWMTTADASVAWPFESVMTNLPDAPYEGRAYV